MLSSVVFFLTSRASAPPLERACAFRARSPLKPAVGNEKTRSAREAGRTVTYTLPDRGSERKLHALSGRATAGDGCGYLRAGTIG